MHDSMEGVGNGIVETGRSKNVENGINEQATNSEEHARHRSPGSIPLNDVSTL